ncbi:transposase [Rhodococcus maanshanensis]|uniref:transposase n=1 Tax=Rhodococcus maanshanensis TaxID=183556 RepID=UPI003CCFE847
MVHPTRLGRPPPTTHAGPQPAQPTHLRRVKRRNHRAPPDTTQKREASERCPPRVRGSDGALAVELTAWMQTLALTETEARRWDPKKVRLRQFSIAGWIVRHAGGTHLRRSAHAPWRHLIEAVLAGLDACSVPARPARTGPYGRHAYHRNPWNAAVNPG